MNLSPSHLKLLASSSLVIFHFFSMSGVAVGVRPGVPSRPGSEPAAELTGQRTF